MLILGTLGLAGILAFLRPQNPCKNMNPLYGMMDTGSTGTLAGSGWSWVWQVVPPLATALVLILFI